MQSLHQVGQLALEIEINRFLNVLTIDALDPKAKIPEYKVAACRIERGDD